MCSHFSTRNRILPFHAQSSAPSATGGTQSPKWTWTTWPEAAPLGGPQSPTLQLGKVTGTSAGQRTLGPPPSHRCGARPMLTARYQQGQGELVEQELPSPSPSWAWQSYSSVPQQNWGQLTPEVEDLGSCHWLVLMHTLCQVVCWVLL